MGKKKKDKEREDRKEEKKEKEKKPKAPQGPVHIGSSEIVLKSELDPAIFAQCKEKMRNVKKSLKALDKLDSCKPQAKHLDTRAAYLLRAIAKKCGKEKKKVK